MFYTAFFGTRGSVAGVAVLLARESTASEPQVASRSECRTSDMLTASEWGRIKMQHDRPDFPTMEEVEKANQSDSKS
jgi:hypothetical protein